MTSLKEAVECYEPYKGVKLNAVNILMIGPVGSGKSSFYNTITSIFRGRISSQAPAGSVEHSLTSQVSIEPSPLAGSTVSKFICF